MWSIKHSKRNWTLYATKDSKQLLREIELTPIEFIQDKLGILQLKKDLQSALNTIAELEGEIQDLESDVESKLDNFKEEIFDVIDDKITDKIEDYDLDDITSRIDELENKIEYLPTEDALNDLDNKVDDIDEKIDALAGDVEEIEEPIVKELFARVKKDLGIEVTWAISEVHELEDKWLSGRIYTIS